MKPVNGQVSPRRLIRRKWDKIIPAISEKQRVAAAIALHHPEKLYERNKDLLEMGKEKLRHYALKKKKSRGLKRRNKYASKAKSQVY